MGKSWQRHKCLSDYGRTWTPYSKKKASKKARRVTDLPNGAAYKRVYNSWDIFDYKFTQSPEEQADLAHHPEVHWKFPHEEGYWYRERKTLVLRPPRFYRPWYGGPHKYKIRQDQEPLPSGWKFDTATGEFLEPRGASFKRHFDLKNEITVTVLTDRWIYIERDMEKEFEEFEDKFEEETRNYRWIWREVSVESVCRFLQASRGSIGHAAPSVFSGVIVLDGWWRLTSRNTARQKVQHGG